MNKKILIDRFREYKSGILDIKVPVYDFMIHNYVTEPLEPQKICDFWSTVFAIRNIEELMKEQDIDVSSEPFIMFSDWFKNLYPVNSPTQKRLSKEHLKLYAALHYDKAGKLYDFSSEAEIRKESDFLATDILAYPIIDLYGYDMPTLSLNNGFFSKNGNFEKARQYIYDVIKSDGTLIAYMPFSGKEEGYAFAYRFTHGNAISMSGTLLTAVCNTCMPVSWLHTHTFKEPFTCPE